MSAIKPIENRRVVGVPSERYPLNGLCAHPECGEEAVDPHHIFPRSMIGNDSWFVAIEDGPKETTPHVTGLCRLHHDEVEAHAAWIKLEDGKFSWHKREGDSFTEGEFIEVGPLDPQPCSGEKRKKPSKRLAGDARRKRRTISIKVPDDTEDGGALWDEALENIKARLVTEGLYSEDDRIPVYEALMAALNDWLASPPSEPDTE